MIKGMYEIMVKNTAYENTLLQNLKGAASMGQLSVEYQPQFNLVSGKLVGFEALSRWTSPHMGSVPPSSFIVVAENNGLIFDIEEFVRDEAVKKLYDNLNFMRKHRIHMSINLSTKTLSSTDHGFFSDHVLTQLSNLGIPCDLLTVEITESAILDMSHEVHRQIIDLRSNGVKVAIDDFGKGYSSLDRVRGVDVDYIKIDKSFVDDIANDWKTRIIVGSVIRMSHSLGLEVVAEGVETVIQRDVLFELRCDIIQGYLVGRPVKSSAVERFFDRG